MSTTERPTVILKDLPVELANRVVDILGDTDVAVQTAVNGQQLPPPPPTQDGRVIVVISPKGGSGKTAVATNLAAVLSKQHPGQVVAVDLDLQFGDLCTSLSLHPERNLSQLAQAPIIDSTTVKVFLTPADTGLFVLCAASRPEDADVITDRHVSTVLQLLARDFAYVVVDTPAGLDERTLSAVENATELLLVSSLDVTSIRSLRKAVDTLQQMGIATPRTFVLNRADAKVGLTVDDAAKAVGLPVACTIPSSRDVPLAMNLGQPVVQLEPKSAVSKQFGHLARLFDSTIGVDGKRRRR